jgi:hypothetical protein
MSDFSGLEQSFALSAVLPLGEDPPGDELPILSTQVLPHELGFRRLRGPREIARILHLREELTLSAAALADPAFGVREKKETRWESSAPSCASAKPSGPSVSCR